MDMIRTSISTSLHDEHSFQDLLVYKTEAFFQKPAIIEQNPLRIAFHIKSDKYIPKLGKKKKTDLLVKNQIFNIKAQPNHNQITAAISLTYMHYNHIYDLNFAPQSENHPLHKIVVHCMKNHTHFVLNCKFPNGNTDEHTHMYCIALINNLRSYNPET